MAYPDFVRQVGIAKWLRRWPLWQIHKRVIRRDIRLTLPNGRMLYLPVTSPSAGEVFVTDCDVDHGAEALMHAMLPPRACFVDVGAHIGYYTAYMADRLAMAYAFEPAAGNQTILARNLYGIVETHIEQMFCADEDRMSVVSRSDHWANLAHREGTIVDQIPCVRLDTYFADFPGLRIDAIKIDVDGIDLLVARGAAGILARDRPLLLMETGNHAIAAWRDFFAPLGYRLFAFIRTQATAGRVFAPVTSEADRMAAKMIFAVHEDRADALLATCARLYPGTHIGYGQPTANAS